MVATTVHALTTGIIDAFYVFSIVIPYHDDEEKSGDEQADWTLEEMIGVVILAFTACIVFCLCPLSTYHGKLACAGQTTNEDLRGKYSRYGGNIFDEGCPANCRAFCYGGTSRVLQPQNFTFNDEELSRMEPNIFVIH